MIATRARTPALTSDDAPKRAVIYTRISLVKDKTDTKGVDRQEEACRALAAARGWAVVEVVTENDTSASKGKRTKYQSMITDVRAGIYDVIIAWAVDRLTRSPLEIEDLITLAESTGVVVATCSGDLDLSTDAGRLVGRILGSVARGEVERKGARQRAAHRQSVEAGEVPKWRAFGYAKTGEIDPVEGPVVRELFTRYVAGSSIAGLTRWLNDSGHLSTRKAPWTPTGVSTLLANPRYVSERWLVTKDRTGVQVREVRAGVWEPLVSEETFRAVAARLADNATRNPKRGPNLRHLCSTLLTCGKCGSPMIGWWGARKLKSGEEIRTLYYACRPTMHTLRKVADVDPLVTTEVVARLRMRDVIAALMAQETNADRAQELNDRIVGLRGAWEELKQNQGLPIGHPDRMSAALAAGAERQITAEIEAIGAKLAKLGDRTPLALVAGAADPGEAWHKLIKTDLKAAQAVVRALVTAITVMPGKRGRTPFDPSTVRFEWRQPGGPADDHRV